MAWSALTEMYQDSQIITAEKAPFFRWGWHMESYCQTFSTIRAVCHAYGL